MARVTSKLQVTVPKTIANQFAIRPGDEIDWVPAGDGIRVVKRRPAKRKAGQTLIATRLRQFDEASRRQSLRGSPAGQVSPSDSGRGWSREDLYRRGRAR
jgi:AbrB family looped-hinge helix DNA binding protein